MTTSESAFSVDPEIMALVSRARIAQADFEAFTQEQVDKIRTDFEAKVRSEITTGPAQYSPEECIAILPQPENSAPSDTSSSAM